MRTPLLRLRKHASNASKSHASSQRTSMRRAVQVFISALEQGTKEGQNVDEIEIEVVNGMVDVKSSEGIEAKVIQLVERLSNALCSKTYFY